MRLITDSDTINTHLPMDGSMAAQFAPLQAMVFPPLAAPATA